METLSEDISFDIIQKNWKIGAFVSEYFTNLKVNVNIPEEQYHSLLSEAICYYVRTQNSNVFQATNWF